MTLFLLQRFSVLSTNLPGTFLVVFACFGSLVGGLFSATAFSRAFNLSFCSFNSNSTLKNPAQYNMIDKIEIAEANEGDFCFWAVILDNFSNTQFWRRGCLLSQGQGKYHEYGQLAKFSAIFITYRVLMLGKVQACFGTALISMVFTCNL